MDEDDSEILLCYLPLFLSDNVLLQCGMSLFYYISLCSPYNTEMPPQSRTLREKRQSAAPTQRKTSVLKEDFKQGRISPRKKQKKVFLETTYRYFMNAILMQIAFKLNEILPIHGAPSLEAGIISSIVIIVIIQQVNETAKQVRAIWRGAINDDAVSLKWWNCKIVKL